MISIRLLELEPEWVHDWQPKPSWRRSDAIDVTTAQGIFFLCPQCFHLNHGPVGTHAVLLWFADRGVPNDAEPGPGRWKAKGTSFADLTLSPSININSEHWHGYIENGMCTMVKPRAFVTAVRFSR